MTINWDRLPTQCPPTMSSGEPSPEWDFKTLRAKVPGGWLVFNQARNWGRSYSGMTFLPDPDHRWDGTSIGGGDAAKHPREFAQGEQFPVGSAVYQITQVAWWASGKAHLGVTLVVTNAGDRPVDFHSEDTVLISHGKSYSLRNSTGGNTHGYGPKTIEELQPGESSKVELTYELQERSTDARWQHKTGAYRVKLDRIE